ncbi:prophage LambdaW5, minor tail protein Z_ [methanotrophic bacterial endosymbiont of Bathymodiolus sp.]|nr:prophage LambdaW5, minor tail protein Z_ [methanotrophic bacterial endosymbiont of Bathymodiolus sp.]
MLNITVMPQPQFSEWNIALGASERQIKTAAVRALNKTARWMRTHIARQAAQSLNVRVGTIRKELVLLRAKGSNPYAGVAIGKASGVIKASELGSPRQNKQGTCVGKRQFDRSFMATMPSGHRGVFRRKGKSRLPIQEVQLVTTGRIANVMEELADKQAMSRFETLFEHELKYAMKAA